MNTEQIEEGNKLIFQFIKSEIKPNYDTPPQYHNDWNVLMSAVQLIQASGYRFYFESNEESIKARFADMGIPDKTIVEVISRNSNMDAVWNLAVSFAKWDNNQQFK